MQCLPNVSRCDSIIVNQKGNDWICSHCVKEVFPFNHLDEDSQFYEAVSEFCGPAAAPTLYDLDDKLFVPFDLNDSDYDYNPLFDVDPDENFFNEVYKYCVSEYSSFKDKCSQYSITDSKCFSLIHVNSHSLYPKIWSLWYSTFSAVARYR